MIERNELQTAAFVDQETGDWFDFKNKVLNELGKDIPSIKSSESFLKNAQNLGHKNGRTFLSGPARHWLMAVGLDGGFDRLNEENLLGSRYQESLIVFSYYAFTTARFSDIGDIFGYTSGNVPIRLYRRMLQALNDVSSQELKSRINFEQIDFGKAGVKKRAPQRSDEFSYRLSASRGGKLRELGGLISEGVVDPEVLAINTGLTTERTRKSLSYFRERKLLPPSLKRQVSDLAKNLEAAQTSEDLDALPLNLIGSAFIKNHKELFVSMSELVSGAGFACSLRELNYFLGILTSADLKVLKVRYSRTTFSYYLPLQELKSATNVLLNSQDLKFYKFVDRYEQIAGPTITLPGRKTAEKQYVRVFEIMRRLDVPRYMLNSSPVPVLAMPGNGFLVSNSDIGEFRQWLSANAAALRLSRNAG